MRGIGVVGSGSGRPVRLHFRAGQLGGELRVDHRHDQYRQELCLDLRNDVSPSLVLGKLRRLGFASTEAAIILTAAVNNLCPAPSPWLSPGHVGMAIPVRRKGVDEPTSPASRRDNARGCIETVTPAR